MPLKKNIVSNAMLALVVLFMLAGVVSTLVHDSLKELVIAGTIFAVVWVVSGLLIFGFAVVGDKFPQDETEGFWRWGAMREIRLFFFKSILYGPYTTLLFVNE